MLPKPSMPTTVLHQLDKAVLYSLTRRVSDSLEETVTEASSLEAVLAETHVNRDKTAVYQLTAPGEHTVWLDTAVGDIRCRVRVRPATDPHAPLLIFHHGFNEYPYTSSWKRIFRTTTLPYHLVCVQAPYHDSLRAPVDVGFQSITSIYQIFAGSLRLIDTVQRQFAQEGAAHTVVAGVSWGGITSVLYEALFHKAAAVIPMLASPNLAQVLEDSAALFSRPISVTHEEMVRLLDFTPYYGRCASQKLFPLLGEHDLFFRFDHHADIYSERPLATIPAGHISAMFLSKRLRQHIVTTLSRL